MIVTFKWTERNGTYNELRIGSLEDNVTTFDTLRTRAMNLGYPGHAGGWWNWFVDDAHAFLMKVRLWLKEPFP